MALKFWRISAAERARLYIDASAMFPLKNLPELSKPILIESIVDEAWLTTLVAEVIPVDWHKYAVAEELDTEITHIHQVKSGGTNPVSQL